MNAAAAASTTLADRLHQRIRWTIGRGIYLQEPWVDYYLRTEHRHHQVEDLLEHGTILEDPGWRKAISQARAELEQDCSHLARRRDSEQRLARYIDHVTELYPSPKLQETADSLRYCHVSGCWGVTEHASLRVAWDHKCHLVRLCPHEAREETMRLGERYGPAILEWAREKPTRRLQWAVFTIPNAPPGQLQEAKREAFERFKARILKAREEIPAAERRGRKRYREVFPEIRGALAIEEDPLSQHQDWNVHLNVLLCIEGPCSWERIRQEWGCQVEIQALDKSQHAIAATIRELVKYSAQIVPEKAEAKGDRSPAPAMTEWPAARWIEWWEAQRGFRRTRSYGCLYGIPEPPPPVERPVVEWCGQIRWTDAGEYQLSDPLEGVGLTPADKSPVSLPRGDNFELFRPPP